MRRDQEEVWARLKAFQFDKPGARSTFLGRLAKENGWSRKKAERALEEYRRFLLLAATNGHPVSPSKSVDEVWHLHLTYSRSYWEELCPHVLCMNFHHEPSSGLPEEHQKLKDGYRQTWNSYRETFGIDPPKDLWPPPKSTSRPFWRFGLRGPNQILQGTNMYLLAMLALPTNLAVVAPWNLKGPAFIQFYLVLMTLGFAVAWIVRQFVREPDNGQKADALSKYEVACLVAGERRAVEAAIVQLTLDHRLELQEERSGLFGWHKSVKLLSTGRKGSDDPLETLVLKAVETKQGKLPDIVHEVARDATHLTNTLKSRGLAETAETFSLAMVLSTTIIAAVLATGAVKLVIGMSLGKPVGWLIVMLVTTFVALIMALCRPRLTPAGYRIQCELAREWQTRRNLRVATFNDDGESSTDTIMAVCVLGAAAIEDPQLDLLRKQFVALDSRGSSGSFDGGSSSCGGGGCGGGCGGCGGCGG
jgi:uncharacterized protein (TIGR04222 family)